MSMETAMIGAVLMTGAVFASRQTPEPAATVPLLNTTAWQGAALKYGDQLLVRRDTTAERTLLLKHSAHDGAYRYDARTRGLAPAPEPAWSRADGAIAECGKQAPPAPQALRIDSQSKRLIAGQREVPTAGPTVLALVESPGHRYAAVLSADGPASKSILPSLGAGSATGQRFHQVISLPDAAVIGSAIRIPVRRNEDVLALCWSADENAVVYHDILFSNLSVVEVDR
jgi:hypothetical protein